MTNKINEKRKARMQRANPNELQKIADYIDTEDFSFDVKAAAAKIDTTLYINRGA